MLTIRDQLPFYLGTVGTSWQVIFVPPNDGATYVLQDVHVPLAGGYLEIADVTLVPGAVSGDAYGSTPAAVDRVIAMGADSATKMNYSVPYGRMLVAKASATVTTLFAQGVLAK